MKIVIAGGTGFLGQPLAAALAADGHDVVLLSRRGPRRGAIGVRTVAWTPDGTAGPWAAEIDGAGAVVNLAGESIAARRWTRRAEAAHPRQPRARDAQPRRGDRAPRRRRRRSSSADRRSATTARSAIEIVDGRHARRAATSSRSVCVQWEAEADRAPPARARASCCIRTGLVLERDGGALPQDAAAVLVRRRRPGRDRAASTGRGFTGRTGSISCGSRSTRRP